MAGKLDFYQIIYDESQRAHCYPFAKVYFNETLTDYFENDVIARLVPESDGDLIAVCSWRLAQKRGDSSTPFVLKNDLALSEEKILAQDFDVAILTPRRPSHLPLYMASQWHGKAWDDAFKVFTDGFLRPMGITVPDINEGADLKRAIYENHFIAKKEVYRSYVTLCLIPALNFCRAHSVFEADSGYILKKRDANEIRNYQQKSGRRDWPIGVFVIERLFSIWIDRMNLNVINL